MGQFGKIFKFELKNYFKNKTFVGITLVLVVLIAAVLFFPRLAAVFDLGGGEDADSTEVMLVQSSDPVLTQAFAEAFDAYEVRATSDGEAAIKDAVRAGDADCAFVLKNEAAYVYYVNNRSMYDSNTAVADELLAQRHLMGAMAAAGMDDEAVAAALSPTIDGRTEMLGVDQAQNFFYTYVMIFALYMVILLYGQMVATNVATEKSSRAMELLITSAKPVSMMFGKVLASCLAGFVQLAVIFGAALLCYRLNADAWADNAVITALFDIPPAILGYMLVFFVLGFLLYAFLFGAIGSTVSKLEDINTAVMPLTFLFIVALIVVVVGLTSGDVNNLAMMICSYVPFTSPMAMFTRIAMSNVAWWEIALSIGLLAASVVAVGVLSAKIYRVGVLLYGTTPKFFTLLKSVWRA